MLALFTLREVLFYIGFFCNKIFQSNKVAVDYQ